MCMWIQTESSNQDSKKQERERKKMMTLYKTINTGTFTKWGNGNSWEVGWIFMDTSRFAAMYYR